MPKEILFDENAALRKATELFWAKGYNGTSMDELTKATGLSRSSIYNTFGGKHELFMRCLQFYQDDQVRLLGDAVRGAPSPKKKIKEAFRFAMEELIKDEVRKGCLVVNTTTEMANQDPEIAVVMTRNMEAMEGMFAEWVKEGQAVGEIPATFPPKAVARHLFNSFSGLRVSGKAKPDRKSLEDIVRVALSVLE